MRIGIAMKIYLPVIGIILLAALLCPLPLHALDRAEVWNRYRDAESAFRQANELLVKDPVKSRDLFEKAALSFEAIHSEGGIENGRLFYNIGNVYFRLGDIGKAILNYRRAERFIPNDMNLQQNLNYARSRCPDKIEPKPQDQVFRILFFWYYDIGAKARAWILAVFLGLLWILASVYLLKKKAWLRYIAASCAVPALLLACSLAVDAYRQVNTRSGVILETEVVGRKGDSTTFEPTFREPLHAGAEFTLVEKRTGWLYIELADSRRCWIPESAAEMI